MEQSTRPSQGTILVVDDEPDIVSLLDEYFSSQGFRVLTAHDGATALKRAERSPDLIVLDVGLPLIDGYTVCRRLREHLSCPIVFLTARVEDVDALEGFEAGADDYVLKPFSLAVLGARVRAHLAREGRQHARAEVRFDGDLVIDYRARTAQVAGTPIELTRREFDIVAFLSKHAGQVFERERIHERVGGWENESDPQVVTEHIRRIRKKLTAAGLAHDPIETVWGMGYKWRA
ncbi:DNA-binding response regulator [Gordonibacter sp. An230]|uniref:response regulator transcription factor n=1 Tax=Gordonibacter sp. An230 TaxID=1965592 RepID=UPI000B382474|nr:response regulator transcription factor [Gordonibacter sp. An230]OUO89525.1 DNA-binding response regulator [Gordonibacter sp. An230]